MIWAVAQNFYYFLAAALVNAVWRVTENSWRCLLVEDTDERLLVDIWSWVYIAGLLAAFVSPLTGVLIDKFSLVPTIRGLYFLAFAMMTTKFIVLNVFATETQVGLVRMAETKSQPLFAVLREYPAVFRHILRSPATLLTMGLMLVLSISRMVNGTFWSILVTENLGISEAQLSLYAFAKSITMLLFFFLVMPRLRTIDERKSMIFGYLGLIASQVLLISIPEKSFGLLLIVTMLEACSIPAASTLLDKLVVTTVDAKERARIMAILTLIVILFTSPFGWIAGQLSEMDRRLPFGLNIALFGIGIVLTVMAIRWTEKTADGGRQTAEG